MFMVIKLFLDLAFSLNITKSLQDLPHVPREQVENDGHACEQTIICITRLTSYQELLQHTDWAIMYC